MHGPHLPLTPHTPPGVSWPRWIVQPLAGPWKSVGGAGVAPFDPSTLSGYGWGVWPQASYAAGGVWQDLAKTTAAGNGDPVRVITDPYSSIDVTFGAGAARPVLTVSGTQAWLTLTAASSQVGVAGTGLTISTIAAVYGAIYLNSMGGGDSICAGTAGSGTLFWYISASAKARVNNDNVVALPESTTVIATTTWYDLGFEYSSPNGRYRRDGADDGTFSQATTFTAALDRVSEAKVGVFLDGRIAGFGCWSALPSDAQRTALEEHLASLHP